MTGTEQRPTLRVSTLMIHTTKAPMLVALPLTTVWPVISTLLAQHALLRSLCSLVSLSRRVMAPTSSSESVDAPEMLRWCALPELRQYGGVVDELGEAASPLRPLSLVAPAARLSFGAVLPAQVVVVLLLPLVPPPPPVAGLSSTADAIQACTVATFMWVRTFGCLRGMGRVADCSGVVGQGLLAHSDCRVQMVDLC